MSFPHDVRPAAGIDEADCLDRGATKVAIIGGGCAALSAAFELTRPSLGGRYEVTVYQLGWRLGGKGASGRGASNRIEEHGLHLWMGYYENAFRLLRECYAELGRDPERSRISRWSDAFLPANQNVAMDWTPDGAWRPWVVDFPAAPGLPGDGGSPRQSIVDYMVRSASLVRTLLRTLQAEGGAEPQRAALFPDLPEPPLTAGSLRAALARLLEVGSLAGLAVAIEAAGLLERALGALGELPQSALTELVDVIGAGLRRQLERLLATRDSARRLWEVCDLLLAVIRGAIRSRVAFDPRGLDVLDGWDCREWLKMNGASAASLNSTFIRSMYDLAFAYEGGDPRRPRIAAGAALRGAFRAFFGYRGAFFWKLRAGMGDVVFAPLYEVLRARGVRFEFFHKLTNVCLGPELEGRSYVAALELDVQARLVGEAYEPLIDVAGLPCWPAAPRHEQLVEGDQIREQGWDLESQWDSRRAGVRRLEVSKDFDLVVLAIGLGVIPYTCRELLARDERWRRMARHVKAVPTQAFQLWLSRPMTELGWRHGVSNVSGFVEPFDTWADMTHLAPEESWREPPRAIAYFCSVLAERAPSAAIDWSGHEAGGRFVSAERELVFDGALSFLSRDVRHLWPGAVDASGEFRWDCLLGDAGAAPPPAGSGRLLTQYWTANVRPADLYSQALPGSTEHRISPLDDTYDNMTVAGDWTSCSLNMGCVEAAVMSGMLAAHAIAQQPALADIVGFDHP